MNKNLEDLIDDIVKAIDEDVFEDYYDETTSIDPSSVESERDILRDMLEPYVDDAEFLKALRQVGIEDFEGYEQAVAIYGRPLFDE